MADESSSKELIIPGKSKKIDSKEDAADIVKAIEECGGLTMLKLSGNSFGEEAMKAVGECLSRKPQLTRALWSDMFVSRLKTEIPPALTSLAEGVMSAQACLTELDLSDNAFGPVGVEALVGFLTSSSCFTLKVARFNNNGLGIKGGSLLSRALLDCHAEAQKEGKKFCLEVFMAGRNRLENEGAQALSRVFEALGTLVHVSVPQNGINPEGVSALAKAFSKNPGLQIIDLNDNTVTEEGSEALAEVLPSLQELRTLNLGDCLVRDEGAKAIAGAIKDGHKLLQDINLSFCELGKETAIVVADSLSNKEELKRIDLNGNCFERDGIALLRESLEAKDLLDALQSLSDDEGLTEDEDEEEGGASEDEEDVTKEEKPTEQTEEDVSTDEKLQVKEKDGEPSLQPISLEVFLTTPTGEHLIALGKDRAELIVDSLARDPQDDTPSVEEVAAMYTTVTSSYLDDESDTAVKQAVESTADALLRPLFEGKRGGELLNQILVQVGLLKSEDKKFKPVTDVEGPLLALRHVVRQPYFPKPSADLLIAFLMKPCPIVDKLLAKDIISKILQVLHTL